MKSSRFCYSQEEGWNVDRFPLTDGPQTLVLIFAAPEYIGNPQIVRDLADHYKNSVVVGCSTSGEISEDLLVDESLTAIAIEFRDARPKLVCEPIESPQMTVQAAIRIGNQLVADDLRAILVFSDGLRVNGSELATTISKVVGPDVNVVGGLAGDAHRFERTFVIAGGEVSEARIVAVGLYGESLEIGSSSKGGWDPFGHERVISKAEGNKLFELDGKRALDVYKEYLGEDAAHLPASALRFPISVRENQHSKGSLVRTILSVDEEEGSLTFAGDIPSGGVAQFMYGNFDRLIDAAGEAAKHAVGASTEPVVALAVSCVGRRLVLGERIEEELESVMEMLPAGSQMLGFYSYGELSTLEHRGCELYNESFTISTIREAG